MFRNLRQWLTFLSRYVGKKSSSISSAVTCPWKSSLNNLLLFNNDHVRFNWLGEVISMLFSSQHQKIIPPLSSSAYTWITVKSENRLTVFLPIEFRMVFEDGEKSLLNVSLTDVIHLFEFCKKNSNKLNVHWENSLLFQLNLCSTKGKMMRMPSRDGSLSMDTKGMKSLTCPCRDLLTIRHEHSSIIKDNRLVIVHRTRGMNVGMNEEGEGSHP